MARTVHISRDGVHVGVGLISIGGEIYDMDAELGEDHVESEKNYRAIEELIAKGKVDGCVNGYYFEVV